MMVPSQADPDEDFSSCFVVALAIAGGAFCGFEWHNLDNHSASIASALHIPQDWVWFFSFLILVGFIGGCALIFPLWITRASETREVVQSQNKLGKKSM